jgi:hypothetical protein
MNCNWVQQTVCGALAALALIPAIATAGDNGKSRRSEFSQSGGGGGGGNNGGSNSSMKFHASTPRNFSGWNNNGGQSGSSMSFKNMSGGNNNGPTSLSTGKYSKGPKNFQNQSLNSNLFANQSSGPSSNSNGRARRASNGDQWNSNKFADAFKNGKFNQTNSGNGHNNGPGNINGGNGPQSGKFKKWDPNKFADVIKHGGNGSPGNGFPGNGGVFPGNGGIVPKDWHGSPGKGDKFCDTPNKDWHHKKNFPWWTIGIGGCYPHNYPNNCYPNDCYGNKYHNHCYAPIYYRYPPVTNVTVVNPAPLQLNQAPQLPAQPALVDGVDLELLDLRLVDPGDATKNLGPRYRITFRNRGRVPAGNFQVMLLASNDGTPQPGLPSGTAEIAGVAPGETLTADVRLTMTPDLATLNALTVALDSATQVVEFEEGNNVAVLDRTKITPADLAMAVMP